MSLEKMINQVILGDCLEVMKEIPDGSIDLLYTDPPYNQEFNGGGCIGERYEYRKEDIKPLCDFNPIEFLEVVKPKFKNFHAYIWTSKNLLPVYLDWITKNNLNFDILIWQKNNPIPAYNNKYLSDVEYCLFIRGKNTTWNNGLGMDIYRKVMTDNVAKNEYGHPTQKHIWMVAKMLKISSKENDLILDPYFGSGTTGVACKQLHRNFIGIEKEPKYVEIARNRLSQSTLF